MVRLQSNASTVAAVPMVTQVDGQVTHPRLHPGHDGSLGSFEYLVYENVLRSLGEAAGLQPVFDYGDEQLERMLDPVSGMETMSSGQPLSITLCTRSLAAP